MSKKMKIFVPIFVLAVMLLAGATFVLTQNNSVQAAGPYYNSQACAADCDPDDCPANNGGICDGNGQGKGGRYGNCAGARSVSCPCGER